MTMKMMGRVGDGGVSGLALVQEVETKGVVGFWVV